MLSLATATLEAMHAKGVKTFYLYELDWKDGETPKYWTNWTQEIFWNSHTYEPFAVTHGDVEQGVDGKLSPVTISVGNIDQSRTIQAIIEDNDVVGRPVTVHQFFFDAGDNLIDDPITVTFKITGAKAVMGQVDFALSIGFDFLIAQVPVRTMHQRFCRWDFMGTECKFSGSPTPTCLKTWEECEDRNNTINFGGFPGILNNYFYF